MCVWHQTLIKAAAGSTHTNTVGSPLACGHENSSEAQTIGTHSVHTEEQPEFHQGLLQVPANSAPITGGLGEHSLSTANHITAVFKQTSWLVEHTSNGNGKLPSWDREVDLITTRLHSSFNLMHVGKWKISTITLGFVARRGVQSACLNADVWVHG